MQQAVITKDRLPIDNMQLTSYLDSDLASQLNEYCANHLGMSVDEYFTNIVGSPKYLHDSFGYNLGDNVSNALISFMKGGQTVDIYSTPSDQLKKIRSIQHYSRQSIALWLNLKIELNGEKVLVQSNANNDFKKKDIASESQLNAKKPKPKYHSVPISSISKLTYKKLKIARNNKGEVEGVMLKYSDNTAFIEVRKHGGKATYRVPLNDIKKLQVYK